MEHNMEFDKTGKKLPYKVPDGFFRDFSGKILEQARKREKRKKIILLVVRLSAAASVLLLLTLGYIFLPGLREVQSTVADKTTEPVENQALAFKEKDDPAPSKGRVAETEITTVNDKTTIESRKSENLESLLAELTAEELATLEGFLSTEIYIDELHNNE